MFTTSQKFDKGDQTASFPFLVLTVSILLTVGITYIFYQSSKSKDAIRFNNEVNRLQYNVENKINLYIALLKGGRGFIDSNRAIAGENFAEYVNSLNLERNYGGIRGIGYAQVISVKEHPLLIEKMRAENYADFQIFPAVQQDVSAVVLYLEPRNEVNRQMIGFDLSSEAKRRETLEAARDSGEAVSSPKINFVRNSESVELPGFVLCLPVYKGGRASATAVDRRKNISGYVYSPFQADDFLREVQDKESAAGVLMRIYDGAPSAENLLVQTADNQNVSFQNQIDESYAAQKDINVAGRNWTIQYASLPAFAAQSSLGWSPLIFSLGIIFSFLLFGMTYWETSARIKLQKTAAELFEAEQQKQGLLEKEQAARLSAEQANRTKDEFIAVVSHELRTPLNAIGGWTRILGNDDLSGNTKKLALEKIDKNLRSQANLVEELLDYSQIISGTSRFEGGAVNFSQLFENVFSEVARSAQEKNIEFVKNNQLNGRSVTGDEEKLKIVIHNLLNNAVKFTPANGRVEISVTEDDAAVQLRVKDNGRGISPEFLPHIFDRFSQADTSSTRASGGLGLGLTIAKHIVMLHDGSIEAVSEGVGKGATLIVTIPRRENDSSRTV